MSHIENRYEVREERTADDLRYYFISKGEADIVKTIRYRYLGSLKKKDVFNLGFGDYNIETDSVTDDVESNNGDVYKVFNTVLSTVPLFFKNFPDHYLMVMGSDGKKEYVEKCRLVCNKACPETKYRRFDRRMSIYRSFVDKYFDVLKDDYEILGGLQLEDGSIGLEEYARYKAYYAVALFKRKKRNFKS